MFASGFYHKTKTCLQYQSNRESIDWFDRLGWSLCRLWLCAPLICESVWNKLNADLLFYKFSWTVGQISSQFMCSLTYVNFWVIWWSPANSSQIFANVTLLQQLTDFATVTLFQTFDGGPNLGSTARSMCPSLNLLYHYRHVYEVQLH